MILKKLQDLRTIHIVQKRVLVKPSLYLIPFSNAFESNGVWVVASSINKATFSLIPLICRLVVLVKKLRNSLEGNHSDGFAQTAG